MDDHQTNQLFVTTPTHYDKDHISSVEELYSALGDPGRFAVVVFIIVSLNMLTVATNHAAGVFLDYSPAHTCYAFGLNTTVGGPETATSIPRGQQIAYDCSTTNISGPGNPGNLTRSCGHGQWRYHVSEGESSSVTEWDLVCETAGLAHLSSTLYFVGVMIGGLVFGYLSDLVGRRRAMLMALYLSVGLGLGIAFTKELLVYIVLRALMGIVVQGLLTATYICLLELFGPRFRGYSGNMLYCMWGISLNYLGMMAWSLKDWRIIQLACIAQGAIGLFYLCLAVNFGYWGLTYNTQALVGNHYKNFIISSCPEIFVYITNGFVLSRFGRKRPMMFYFSITTLCCFISCLITTVGGSDMATSVTVVSTIGRLAACGLMGTNDVFMAELYPTVVRNTGVGVCVCVGRFGAVITPIIFSLTEVTFRSLPLLSFGVVTFIGVVMTMLLPDTWNRDLPETLRDLEMTVVVGSTKEELLLAEKTKENQNRREA